ncbi:MAG: carboxypeptidase-like regulatory domain-containing protein [Pirellulales bacterium]
MRFLRSGLWSLCVAIGMWCVASPAQALIRGGEGAEPLGDPGWPKGAAAVFNSPTRVAWWEGPPFGGGHWTAECRGKAAELSQVLADFAKIEAPDKRVVLVDGIGRSFWLNPNRSAEREAAAEVDWTFSVWEPGKWARHQARPAQLRGPDDAAAGAPELIVYTGGQVRWSDVKVPAGLKVIDNSLAAHGFQPTDGQVIEGVVQAVGSDAAQDAKSNGAAPRKPLAGAEVRLDSIEPLAEGGYRYTDKQHVTTDAQGHWVLTQVPPGDYRLVVSAPDYAPRIASYVTIDKHPVGWRDQSTWLAPASRLTGRVVDPDGQPLSEVQVRIQNFEIDGKSTWYELLEGGETKTDGDGKFLLDQIPAGRGVVMLFKSGYCRPGLGTSVALPSDGVELAMDRAAQLRVVIKFPDDSHPVDYAVKVAPESGARAGLWSGSAAADANNTVEFHDIPAGRYRITASPNPSSGEDDTDEVVVELKGGQTLEKELPGRPGKPR